MDFRVAQRELGRAHVGGAPGLFLPAVVWLVAAYVSKRTGPNFALLALFTGGVLIVPGRLLLCVELFRAPGPSANNPLSRLGPETASPLWAVVIGARYAAFRSLYGEPLYWVLGAGIALAGVVSLGWICAVAAGAMEGAGLLRLVRFRVAAAADDGSGD